MSTQRKTPRNKSALRQPTLPIPKATSSGTKAGPTENMVINVAMATGLRRLNQRFTVDNRVIMLNPTVVPAKATAKVNRKCQELLAGEDRTSPVPAAKPPTRTSGRDPKPVCHPADQQAGHGAGGRDQGKYQGRRTDAQAQIVAHWNYEKALAVIQGAAEYRQQGTNSENPPAVEDTT